MRRALLAPLAAAALALAASPASGALVDAQKVAAIEASARPAPAPVRALAAATVRHLRAAGFAVTSPAIVYSRRPLGTVEAYVRTKRQVVIFPRMQPALTELARCVRARLVCATSPAARYAAETLVHETLHTLWTGSPELDALPDYAFETYGEGIVEAVAVDVLPGWYARVVGRHVARAFPSAYLGETGIVQDETGIRACGERRLRNAYCARRARADLLRVGPTEWIDYLEGPRP